MGWRTKGKKKACSVWGFRENGNREIHYEGQYALTITVLILHNLKLSVNDQDNIH